MQRNPLPLLTGPIDCVAGPDNGQISLCIPLSKISAVTSVPTNATPGGLVETVSVRIALWLDLGRGLRAGRSRIQSHSLEPVTSRVEINAHSRRQFPTICKMRMRHEGAHALGFGVNLARQAINRKPLTGAIASQLQG